MTSKLKKTFTACDVMLSLTWRNCHYIIWNVFAVGHHVQALHQFSSMSVVLQHQCSHPMTSSVHRVHDVVLLRVRHHADGRCSSIGLPRLRAVVHCHQCAVLTVQECINVQSVAVHRPDCCIFVQPFVVTEARFWQSVAALPFAAGRTCCRVFMQPFNITNARFWQTQSINQSINQSITTP